jgi:hypothetical protein
MRKHSVLMLAVLIIASVALLQGVSSATKADIRERITDQQERIDRGVRAGSLSRSEADILQGNLDYVRDTFAKAKTDGRLTTREERRLNRMLDQNSEMIYKKKHNMKIRRLY